MRLAAASSVLWLFVQGRDHLDVLGWCVDSGLGSCPSICASKWVMSVCVRAGDVRELTSVIR